uniref:ATP synthase CF1 subunit epsilon n=1 Tax=Crassiphycus birdiae TaxID=2782747 RepID=UPI001D10BC2D|nr:ATP synthase CF1 subunit epsilon [Crassiphycus birdiae]YP_010197189.1 ATP synthase CF1 subunit epsilon [Crassiphycus crassissimus]YP_010199199.1 ATP synthase CF1 subunit epsilon [Crassiphycus usneoides]UAD83150.1 ATP synthase CF1 subunit epsilon [Crassiphycus birdiae]UAD84993.1 ATP synthase CF1 subunit epsilon [Crassiphycus crassissimus]UAD85196.1 ATP synthase CF1 subunit epsilon [Crassiphycus crassissimus]UAD88648.1 ATP synthase CF1 subunit epsilon [Crassiphycus usneoides]
MTLNIRVIAPDRTVWDANAEEVILPSSTGQVGILKGHIPLLTAIDIGVMRVRIEKEWQPIILLGGFAEVKENKITILVNGAEQVSEIDIKIAQENLDKATKILNEAKNDKDKIEATQNLRKARARIQAANVLNN